MSLPTRLAALKVATIWPSSGEDSFGRKSYGAPYTINCTYDYGTNVSYKDRRGLDFDPKIVAWAEFDGSFTQPLEGDMIALGDHTLTASPLDVDDSHAIKVSEISDCSLLMDLDDLKVMA